MSQVSVRIAREPAIEDVRSVLAEAYRQYERSFPPENWTRYLADILDIEARADVSELLVAEREGEVIGCVSYYPPGAEILYPSETFSERWPPEWAAIRLLAVDPSARHGGVGRTLTEACIERSRAQRATAVGLHTTKEMEVARAMYERLGFERAPAYDFHPAPTISVEAYRLML